MVALLFQCNYFISRFSENITESGWDLLSDQFCRSQMFKKSQTSYHYFGLFWATLELFKLKFINVESPQLLNYDWSKNVWIKTLFYIKVPYPCFQPICKQTIQRLTTLNNWIFVWVDFWKILTRKSVKNLNFSSFTIMRIF